MKTVNLFPEFDRHGQIDFYEVTGDILPYEMLQYMSREVIDLNEAF